MGITSQCERPRKTSYKERFALLIKWRVNLSSKRKYKPDPHASNPGGAPLSAEVSTVNSYLYLTRPYPYNPDDIVGKKGIKQP